MHLFAQTFAAGAFAAAKAITFNVKPQLNGSCAWFHLSNPKKDTQ